MRIASGSIIAFGFLIAFAGQANAIPGYEFRTVTITVAAGNHIGSTVFCTQGKKVLGGGFDIQGAGPLQPNYATRSHPASGQDGWNVNVRNNGPSPVHVQISAICAP
ncbi:hypothetical protein [Bradyrhizobium sp.]